MITYANAKLNIGLQITGKRADGYHLLESFFIPIKLSDTIEITINDGANRDELQVFGEIETGRLEDNLVFKAIQSLRELAPIPPLRVSLLKQIPSGAGMGGGSSDATHSLKAIRELCQLKISDERLTSIALGLGADCPFFIDNQPKMVRGIGEVFSPAPKVDLSPYYVVVVKPNLHISTAEAFRGLKRIGGQEKSVEELLQAPIELWRQTLHNEFEDSLFPTHPSLANLKEWLYQQGAIYASMTGSGAALYGLFDKPLSALQRPDDPNTFFWQGRLL